ncbi:efflux RND transporter periplasmic adaptor subunit [Hyphomicrobium sp.]|uniref:efflux RND transporter periplasmic adaptor subunit n=1 Tax=Hyphomicrobium sp. TaxID=82 RepID=UPI002E3166F4|nr:efflux RND transporter periplasmic adaptor subunit [Hyphomicrobium sp.]HEX2842678.1 efflux RND transporter periplasmic adaptor subunit [Hyphomicrobium sp.]
MRGSWFIAAALAMPATAMTGTGLPASARDLAVSQVQVERMAIEIERAKPTSEQVIALLPGTVVPALNARIVAAAPFGGTIVQVLVLPGQKVSKGQDLAVVSSRELLEAASSLAQAEAELQAADAIARRRRDLAEKNIQSPTMADEAEAQVAKIKAVIEQHKRMLALGGISSPGVGTYTIKAPEAGRVVEASVMPGDKIETMAPAVTLDMSDELWIEAQLPAQLVARIVPGDRIKVQGGPEGKVVSVGSSLDKMTRSAKLIASVPTDSRLLPGQMVTLSIIQQAETGALSVPASAIARVDGVESVFVRNDSGFMLVPVEVAGRSPSTATVHGNLSEGAQVAATGLPQLERMLETE